MQTRYIGDVGDFGKYGLLRALIGEFPNGERKLSLGVVWYLVSKHEANNDGKHDGYLNLKNEAPKKNTARLFRECDPNLYDFLRELRGKKKLAMTDINDSAVFPKNTKFYDRALSYDHLRWRGDATKEKRLQDRKGWLDGALATTQESEVVFVDPDNGLENDSAPMHGNRARKYVYLDELKEFVRRGQSLVIYHHLNMHSEHAEQVRNRLKALRASLRTGCELVALRYHRGSGRVFFLVPCRDHEKLFAKRVEEFVSGFWGRNGHFSLG